MDDQDDEVYAENRQAMAGRRADVHREYAVECIVHHIGEGDNIRYFEPCYGYTPSDDIFEAPEHMPEQFISSCWSWLQKNDVVQQWREQAHVNCRMKVPK